MQRIGIFSESAIVRAGLQALLQGRYEVSLHQDFALVEFARETCQAVILHVRSFDVIDRAQPAHIIALLEDETPANIARVMIRGAAGVVALNALADEIERCVAKVLGGGIGLSDSAINAVMRNQRVHITPREKTVLMALVRNQPNKNIGAECAVTEGTVKVYLSRLFRKLRARDRWALIEIVRSNLGPDGQLTDVLYVKAPTAPELVAGRSAPRMGF